MKELPHVYTATATNRVKDETVRLASPGLQDMESAGPLEFDGPGDRWSPETMITAALGDCFILTFRAVAAASKLEWDEVRCDVEAVLDKVERSMRFTEFRQVVTLRLPEGPDDERVQRVLDKAERGCIVRNSLVADVRTRFVIERSGQE